MTKVASGCFAFARGSVALAALCGAAAGSAGDANGAEPRAPVGAAQDPAGAPDPSAEAQKQLELAESRAREGRFADARSEYKRLAAKYPETPAGVEAANRAKPSAFLGWSDVVRNGPSKNRIDVVLMGDGYELGHMDSFVDLAADVPELFARQATFREYYSYFNFLRADLVSADSGVDGFGREYDTALGARTLDTFAGHVGIDHGLVVDVLSKIPDTDRQAIVFVKNGVLGTGGGGIATIGGREVKTIIHEFGHSFGRLADEYDTQTSHDSGSARESVNGSATDDEKLVPWAHWIAAKHPGVGVYQGGQGRARGAWRPTATGCVMASSERFCVVCQEALVLAIYALVDPIESTTPTAAAPDVQRDAREFLKLEREPITLTVEVLKPASHPLEVKWWVLPDELPSESAKAPRGKTPSTAREPRDRTRRGPLPELVAVPRSTVTGNSSGTHKFVVSRKDLEPGRYRVVCRVKDTTRLRGEKFPWVLKDERGLLESERTWWVEVTGTR